MKAVIKRPGEPAADIEIANTLDALQQAVGGYIEVLHAGPAGCLIFNEEGKLKDLLPNIKLTDGRGRVLDIIYGVIIVTGLEVDEEEFSDLTDYQAMFVKAWLDARNI